MSDVGFRRALLEDAAVVSQTHDHLSKMQESFGTDL
jgi:hypothetical protein